jgi:hypothetical protein
VVYGLTEPLEQAKINISRPDGLIQFKQFVSNSLQSSGKALLGVSVVFVHCVLPLAVPLLAGNLPLGGFQLELDKETR